MKQWYLLSCFCALITNLEFNLRAAHGLREMISYVKATGLYCFCSMSECWFNGFEVKYYYFYYLNALVTDGIFLCDLAQPA